MELPTLALMLLFFCDSAWGAAPVWDTPPGDISINKSENINVGETILDLGATYTGGGTLTYSIVSQTNGDHFEIDGTTVKLKADLDYETYSSHVLVFGVTDGTGDPPVQSGTYTVNVVDVNDVSPEFNPNTYSGKVQENSAQGVSVLKVEATDGDVTAAYKLFTYSIQSGDTNNNFVIDGSSGVLSTSANAVLYSNGATITLIVAATDDANNVGTANATINVNAADNIGTENATIRVKTTPVFSEPSGGSTAASVAENSPTDTSVFDVAASDTDGDDITITIASQSAGDNFKVVGTQLRVKEGASLDFESDTTSYTLRFRAEDTDGNVMESDDLAVSVTNVNEPPVFPIASHSLEQEAGVKPPEPIVIMGATDPDEGDTLTYQIADGDSNADFQINNKNGLIQTAKTIAYTSTPFELQITAADSVGLVATGTVTVTLKSAPVLTMPSADGVSQATIAENTDTSTDTGRTVVALTSSDADEDGATFEIVQQSVADAFRVDGFNLVTNALLDYETEPYTYQVVIKVTDDSSLRLSSTGTLSISVTNVNEYSPVFNPTSYSHSLKEQSSGYSNFLQVTAADTDRGDTITFTITGDAGPFAIDSSTGYLSSNAAIVYADAASYSLTITATDSGGLTGTANVAITIIEATNPVFTLPPESGGFTKTIAENTAVDTPIYQISATDADGDRLTYVLTQGSPEFSLDTETRDVKVATALDYDTAPNVYEVIFEARDQNSATSTATLSVSLSDVNDNPPVFSDTPYTTKALEGQATWTQIFQVSATDADSDLDQNNVILFEITAGNVGDKFTIDAATGWISAMDLEFAALRSYSLEITAKDRNGGAGFLPATTNVEVRVATKPVLTQPPAADTAVNKNEDMAQNELVYTLAATDADGDGITYSITSQTPETPAANMFVIDGAQIRAGATQFDADAVGATTTYTLGVRASDGTYYADSSIVVTVVAVNDESPVFNPSSYTTSISEVAAEGTSVVTVTATDVDSDDNSLTFSITGGNDGNAFTMVGRQINTAAALGPNIPSTYTLTVQASDGTNTGIATVTVTLNRSPVWVKPGSDNTAVNMDEDVASGGLVYTLSATDPENDQVSYSIISQAPDTPANLFVIAGAEIKAGNTDFDADADNALTSITLGVRAEDALTYVDSSIVITVVDVNDEDPVFNPTSYTASVWEGAETDTSIVTVTATDADKGTAFNTLTYSITEGNGSGKFTMVGAQINVVGALSYAQPTYTLTVQASDGSRTATATATISLYTKPSWVAPPLNTPASIDENIVAGELVYTLLATDEDGGTLAYALLSQSPETPAADMFVLDGDKIKAGSTAFDYDASDAVKSYTLSVRASSGGDNVDSSLVVTINDVDDEAPVFSPASYSKSLWEKEAIGTSVLTVTATDVDSDSITYTILSSGNVGGAFDISGNQINVAAALDYGTKNAYTLTVRASDGTNQGDATVTISLNTRPVFTLPPPGGISKNIPENIAPTYTVYTIAVSDEDGEAITTTISGTKFLLAGNDVKLAAGETLDFETTSGPFTLSFTATDASGNAITSDNLVITVTDLNDNAPTFTANLFSKTMKTTAPTGSSVISLVATDADSSTNNNNQITYSINSGNTNTDFHISAAGEVTTLNSLTMSTPNYDLEIYAVDGGNPSLTGSTTLTVTVVEPSNPAFTTPPAGGANISIPENQAVNSVIYTLVATDADADTLTYRIKASSPGSATSKFSLSGAELRVATTLDYETETSYTFTFGADDDDNDSSNEATSPELTINITNVNEFTPAFTETAYKKTVTKKFKSGDSVITVAATDGDAGAQIVYSLTAGNADGSFNISSTEGEITTTKVWPGDEDDAATKADLTVQASDGELSNTVKVEIIYNTATPLACLTFVTLILSLSFYFIFTSMNA